MADHARMIASGKPVFSEDQQGLTVLSPTQLKSANSTYAMSRKSHIAVRSHKCAFNPSLVAYHPRRKAAEPISGNPFSPTDSAENGRPKSGDLGY
jgi:hypothetical protein